MTCSACQGDRVVCGGDYHMGNRQDVRGCPLCGLALSRKEVLAAERVMWDKAHEGPEYIEPEDTTAYNNTQLFQVP